MAHEYIQPVSFHLASESLPLSLVSMRFPDAWRAPLAALAGEQARADRPSTFRIASLNAAIAAFTPQLFITPGQVQQSSAPWLIATERVREDKLWRIVRAWVAEHYSMCDGYDELLDSLRVEDLVWEPFTFDLHTKINSLNNTAIIDSLTYMALPAYLAELLVHRQVHVPIQLMERTLVRVPTTDGSAQLQTWPPVPYVEKSRRRAAYSYTITITVQNLVGCARPRVHLAYGIRRWRVDPLRDDESLFLPGREGRTVYLHHPQPLHGVQPSPHFTRAVLKAGTDEQQKRVPIWSDALAGIASRIGATLPDPADLTLTPERFHEPADPTIMTAAIVEKTPRNHPVKTGMGLEVREAITKAILKEMGDVLALTPRLQRSMSTKKTQRNRKMLVEDLRALDTDVRLIAVRESIGPTFTVEVWWQTESGRDQLIRSLHSMLYGPRPELKADPEDDVTLQKSSADGPIEVAQMGMFEETVSAAQTPAPIRSRSKTTRKRAEPELPPINTSTAHTIDIPGGGAIQIVPRPLGAFGRLFPEPNEADIKRKGEYKRRETERRAKEIQQQLEHTQGVPTLAMIELHNFQDPGDRQRRRAVGLRDPKRALRLGMAYTGRVTKFATGALHADQSSKSQGRSRLTPEELLRERCDNAVLEGLRQMGYLPGPVTVTPPDGTQLPEPMVVAGVRMLRLTRKTTHNRIYLPVVTIFATNIPGVYAWLPDGKMGVRPFHEALTDITFMKDKEVSKFKQEDMLVRLERFLTSELPRQFGTDIVILAEAQNMRWLWPGLQNGEMPRDAIRFRKGGEAVPLEQLDTRFRLIRVRTSERYETPQWYTENAEPGRDYASGLFRDPEAPRTFFNIATKPNTQAQARRGKQQDPSEQYAIPSMLEIHVAAQQPNDDDEAWALAVHTWRRMSYLTGGDMTLLPIALQWAQRMDRYARVIGPWVFKDQEHLWVDDNDISDDGDEGELEQLSLFDDESEDDT